MPRLAALACSLLFAAPLFAEAPPVPKVPDGFKCEIVLQAPDIEAPTALCVAPNGDVYFAEDPMDMSGPSTKNLDKIWLLKGGDPKKKVLVADQMWAVMGLEVVRDKLYVVHAPHVTVFTLGGDGTPTKREELFDDLGPPVAGVPSFNDHIPSGIRMGMDGWLYVSVGDKGIPKMARKEKDQGSVHVAEGRWRHTKEGHHISLEGGGVIRFRPDGSGLEVFASGTRNHLDVPLDEHDRIFVRDNTDDGDGWDTRFMYLPRGAFMGYPWAFKQRPQETLPMIHDFGGGAPCGGWVYCDDGLPETYRGRIFHCEWGQGKVWAVKVAPDGAGFKYVDQIAFMDPAGTGVKDFRPFTLRPTADGRGFYVTDWGFSGWLQKVKAGRIYKVTYVKDDVKPAPRGKGTDSVEELIKALNHPAHSERVRAQRELAAKGREGVAALERRLTDSKVSDRAMPHVLWVLRERNSEKWLPLALAELGSRSEDVRIEAVRVLGTFQDANKKKAEEVAGALLKRVDEDSSLHVRMQAAIALATAKIPDRWSVSGHLYWSLFGHETDHVVLFSIIHTLKTTCNWDMDFPIGRAMARPDAVFLVHADVYNLASLKYLTGIHARDEHPDNRRRTVEIAARLYKDRRPYAGTWWGTRPEQQKPPARVVEWEGTPLVRETILKALGDKHAEVRKAAATALAAMNDPATLEPLVAQFEKEKNDDTRTDIVRAVAGLSAPKAVDFLTAVLHEGKHPQAMRIAAVAGLEKFNKPAAVDALALVIAPREPAALQVRALEALGNVKAVGSQRDVRRALKNDDPAVRRAAVVALGKMGSGVEVEGILPLLDDKDATVRIAAIQSLGTLKAKAAVPALIQASGNDATQFDAILALAQMPDKRALTAYLTGLGSKNQDLRKASAQAIAAVREEVLPDLEQLVKRNEVRAEVLPELRGIYQSFVPVLDWKLIGPFPEGKAHPPETELKFDTRYQGAGKEVAWRPDQKGDAKNHGKVNLDSRFAPNVDVVAYGYAEIESAAARDAELLIGSDDTMTIWLNGKKVFEFGGNRGWQYDSDKAKVRLEKGKNALLIKCGNRGGPWEYSVALSGDAEKYAFLKGGAQKYDLEAFRAFARKNAGDAERGKKLFNDVKGLACVKCHAVGGEGGKVGPDLAGIALKYKREDLMTSVLEPSKVIAQGYETIVITTKKGQTITGVFKGETADAINVMDKEGKALAVPKKDVDERAFSPISTMPNGLNEGMTLQDFADVIAYLEARREEKVPPKK
jgi:putative heme-binding domain-containing protein